MDNTSSNINLNRINWNKMTPEEFDAISKSLQEKHKIKKERKRRISTKTITISLKGKKYEIKYSDYERLTTLTSQKSIEKQKDYIIQNYQPILEIDIL